MTIVPVVLRTARAEWQPRLSTTAPVPGKLRLKLRTPWTLVLWNVQTDRLELLMMATYVGLVCFVEGVLGMIRLVVLMFVSLWTSLHRVRPALRHLLMRTQWNPRWQQLVIRGRACSSLIAWLTRLLKLMVPVMVR